jgi:hypothetical protein
MELQLKITGILLILLASIHVIFPKHFDWKGDFHSVKLINKQMMYVHTFFIAVTVFLMGVLCICNSHDILNTRLGNQLSFGLFIFWGLRLIFQFAVYSPRLWKGKRFETIMHIVFSLIWIYLTTIFLLVFLAKLNYNSFPNAA